MISFVKETAPHIRSKNSASQMMMDVIIALLPIVVFAFVIYKLRALMIIGISLFTMVSSEFIYVGLRNKMPKDGQKHTFKELFSHAYKNHFLAINVLAPVVSALIFALTLPANATWYATFIGSLFGIVIGKLVFGGTGANVFNPAAVGMIITKVCFQSSYPAIDYSSCSYIDVTAGGTPLTSSTLGLSKALSDYSFVDLFFGKIGGAIGETFSLLIIIGAVYLLIRRAADYRVMCSYLLTFIIYVLISGLIIKNVNPNNINYLNYISFELLSGGLLFGAVFMITDPVTSPITPPGRVMYGILAAALTFIIRFFAATPEGVGFAILISNMCTPIIDYYKWSSSRYTLKKFIAMGLIFLIPLLIVVIALFMNKGGFWYA